MSTPFWESAELDFGPNEATPVTVNHNQNRVPEVVQFIGVSGGFEAQYDGSGNLIPKPYITGAEDANTIMVYKPDAYTYSGKFKICLY